ncbi:hypothetical protein M9Y10_044174 [Tritrichomonas musculus]|uniref:Thioredoxin domain-containing protein n=1 Tax=Tritrichomonas musculus TaxID=1915356 RepID=A0ABR2K272_9EUKA
MLYLFLFTFITLYRFQKNSKNKALSTLLSEHNDSVVLFYSGDNSMFDQYFSIFNRAYHKYNEKVTIACYDIRRNPDEILSIPINQNPEIAIFKNGEYAGSYYGDWIDTSINSYISSFVHDSWSPIQLNSLTSIIDFKEKEPVNLIFYGEDYVKLAHKFRTFFNNYPAIPIAYVSNQELATLAGVKNYPIIQLNQPLDEVNKIFESFNQNSLKKALVPLISPIFKNQIAGNSIKSQWTLIALVDKQNPIHRHTFAEIVKHCKIVFGTSINYQSCDFFDCEELTQLSSVSNTTNPILFAIKQFELKNSSKPIQYKQGPLVPISVRKWLRKITSVQDLEGDKLAKKLKTNPITSISQSDFIKLVKDNSTDSIFLINIKQKIQNNEGNQNKEHSSSSNEFNQYLAILYKLKTLFKDTENVHFYEFSAELSKDEISKLPLPPVNKMCITLYPAVNEVTHIVVPARDYVSYVEFLLYNIRSPLSSATKKKIEEILPNAVL